MSTLTRMLTHLPLFAGLSPRDLEALESTFRRRPLGQGDTLFRTGEPGRSCFVVLNGEVNILKPNHEGREQRVAALRPGDLFEHMAVMERVPRQTTCVALARSLVLELATEDFARLFMANSTFAFRILDRITRELATRQRAATARLATATNGDLTPDDGTFNVRDAASAVLSGATSAVSGVNLDTISFEHQTPRKDPIR